MHLTLAWIFDFCIVRIHFKGESRHSDGFSKCYRSECTDSFPFRDDTRWEILYIRVPILNLAHYLGIKLLCNTQNFLRSNSSLPLASFCHEFNLVTGWIQSVQTNVIDEGVTMYFVQYITTLTVQCLRICYFHHKNYFQFSRFGDDLEQVFPRTSNNQLSLWERTT